MVHKMKFKSKAIEEKVFKCAEMLIYRHGTKGWNMNDLADSAGITKGTLYKIITSKEQLIHDVSFQNIKLMREKILEVIRSESGFMDRLEQLTVVVPGLLKNNYLNTYSDILKELPGLEADIVSENELIFNDMVSFFKTGIDEGYLRKDISPDLIHHMVQAIILYFAKYSNTGGEFPVKMKMALHCLINGIIIRSDDTITDPVENEAF